MRREMGTEWMFAYRHPSASGNQLGHRFWFRLPVEVRRISIGPRLVDG